MGWFWGDDDDDKFDYKYSIITEFTTSSPNPNRGTDDYCTTRKTVESNCKTEEVKPGKFVRKCEKTEQILRDCFGQPTEILRSNKEYTEEDVTSTVKNGSSALFSDLMQPFGLSGLCSDAIERSIFRGFSRFFEVADEMINEFEHFMDDSFSFGGSPSSGGRHEIPIEGNLLKEPKTLPNNSESGDVDSSGLARDV